MKRKEKESRFQRIRERYGTGTFLLIEAGFGLMGFPGMGWLFCGHPVAGVALICLSPAVAWTLIPIFTSSWWMQGPPTSGRSPYLGLLPMIAYLLLSAVISVTALGVTLSAERARRYGNARAVSLTGRSKNDGQGAEQ